VLKHSDMAILFQSYLPTLLKPKLIIKFMLVHKTNGVNGLFDSFTCRVSVLSDVSLTSILKN